MSDIDPAMTVQILKADKEVVQRSIFQHFPKQEFVLETEAKAIRLAAFQDKVCGPVKKRLRPS